jgi:hypothetical protein
VERDPSGGALGRLQNLDERLPVVAEPNAAAARQQRAVEQRDSLGDVPLVVGALPRPELGLLRFHERLAVERSAEPNGPPAEDPLNGRAVEVPPEAEAAEPRTRGGFLDCEVAPTGVRRLERDDQ